MAQRRIGLIGYGDVSVVHVGAIEAIDGLELVGIADVDPAARERAAADTGLPTFAFASEARKPSTFASSSGTISGATCGAIFGACVSTTGCAGSGAVRVSTGSGGASGEGSGAAAEPSVVMA